jgi:hypothetical protein
VTSVGQIPEHFGTGDVYTFVVSPVPGLVLGRRATADELIWDAEGGFSSPWAGRSTVEIAGDTATFTVARSAFSAAGLPLFATGSGGASGGAVDSVFGRTGAVVATAGDYAVADVTGLSAALADKADNTRSVFAGAGLTGGGDLSTNRTINVVAANPSIFVDVNSIEVGYADSTPAPLGSASPGVAETPAREDHVHPMPTAAQVGAVPTARTVTAGAGLTGGGDLSADRTVNVAAADGSIVVNADSIQVGYSVANPAALGSATPGAAATAARSDHAHAMPSASDVGAPPTARTITAGNGLSGGGSLAADRTLTVISPNGSITIAANGIQVGYSASTPGQVTTAAGSPGAAATAARSDHTHQLPTRTLTDAAQGLDGWTIDPTNPTWRMDGVNPTHYVVATGPDVVDNVWAVEIPMPPGAASLTAVKLSVQGAAGHAALPGVMPSFALDNYNAQTGAVTSVFGAQTDASINTTAYQLVHSILWTGTHTVDPTCRYVLKVTGESGSDSATGLKIHGLRITVSYQ